MIITEESVAKVAREVLAMPHRNDKAEDETFRGFVGAPITIVTDIRNRLESTLENAAKPKHLLWFLA
jgi:hypothetical protein